MFKDTAITIFNAYSENDTIYFTSDGQPFFIKHMADGHASGLKDRSLSVLNRADIMPKGKAAKNPQPPAQPPAPPAQPPAPEPPVVQPENEGNKPDADQIATDEKALLDAADKLAGDEGK